MLKYRSTAGQIPLTDDNGKIRARIFFVYYQQTGTTAASEPSEETRPVTFVFNGGPGAASVWLHLGTAGPKKVHLPEDGSPPEPPYRLEDNPFTWLSFSDLVFIDPVGTGFSRPNEPERAREFYGVQGDIASVADFIRLFCTKYERWPSPKFLAGESYGTTCAAGLSEFLHDRYGVDLNGIVLISTVLNFQTLSPSPGNDLPYALYLPSYATSAWYHKKLSPRLQQMSVDKVAAEVEAWSMSEYSSALAKGTSIDDAAREATVQKLVEYSGLPIEYVRKSNLKISPARFEKALLADQRKVIGRMDTRGLPDLTSMRSTTRRNSIQASPATSGCLSPHLMITCDGI